MIWDTLFGIFAFFRLTWRLLVRRLEVALLAIAGDTCEFFAHEKLLRDLLYLARTTFGAGMIVCGARSLDTTKVLIFSMYHKQSKYQVRWQFFVQSHEHVCLHVLSTNCSPNFSLIQESKLSLRVLCSLRLSPLSPQVIFLPTFLRLPQQVPTIAPVFA